MGSGIPGPQSGPIEPLPLPSAHHRRESRRGSRGHHGGSDLMVNHNNSQTSPGKSPMKSRGDAGLAL